MLEVYLEGDKEAIGFLNEAVQPPADDVEAVREMREWAPATAAVVTGAGRVVSYATVWDPGVEYSAPDEKPESSTWPSRLPIPEGRRVGNGCGT